MNTTAPIGDPAPGASESGPHAAGAGGVGLLCNPEELPMNDTATPIVDGPFLPEAVPSLTVPQFIRKRALRHPTAVAMIDASSGNEVTYGALDHLIGRCAAGLSAQGFEAGDTLLMCSPNSPKWVIAALGAMAAGGRVSGANPSCTAGELTHQMRDSNARFVYTVAPLLAVVRQAAAQTGCEHVVVAGDATNDASGGLSMSALLASEGPEPQGPDDPDALALLPYSSGTTGLPKGVMLTHRAIVTNVCQSAVGSGWPQGVVTLGFLPMFHAMGFVLVTLTTLALGGKLVTLPRFEPEAFLKALAEHRVSHLVVVPPIMQFLAMHPRVAAFDLSALRAVGSGGAPMSAALEAQVAQRLGCPTLQGYGMTETSAVLAMGCPSAPLRAGSVGRLVPGTQARVVDPASAADLPRGQPGELWFRGPQLFEGYLNDPAATAATLPGDGWIRTGDLGFIDADGFVFVTDRLKELIKVKGLPVAPAELEALLLTHPAVADAAVIGRPDARAGELPVAYVVARAALEPDALTQWLAERVAPHKRLADVVLVEAIPKTPAGKLLRRVLRTQDAARTAGAAKAAAA